MVPAVDARPFWPTPLVRLPWGSTSTRRTRRPAIASEAARLMVVVVLPTPPFWFATATTLPMFWHSTKSDDFSVRDRNRGYARYRWASTTMFHVEHSRGLSCVRRVPRAHKCSENSAGTL